MKPDWKFVYDPILDKPTKPVERFDDELKNEISMMRQAMKKGNGIGLAANQVGLDKSLVILEYNPKDKDEVAIPFTVLCNPVIKKLSKDKEALKEGCLSVPRLEASVIRSLGVVVEGQDENGHKIKIGARNLKARVIQHEVDHLQGILFTERADKVTLSNCKSVRIAFFGSDDFSLKILEQLIDSKLKVTAVFSETDKPAGRGHKTTPTIVSEYAKEHQLPLYQPGSREELVELMSKLPCDLAILASYGKIIPAEALAIPPFGWLNVHPSLLPKYRGATPVQSAILNQDSETGVTIMRMDQKVDTGRIVCAKSFKLDGTETFVSLKRDLAELGANLLVNILPKYLSGQVKLETQGSDSVNCRKLAKSDGEIDWSQSPEAICAQIRALNPWPGAYTTFDGKNLKVLEAQVVDGKISLLRVQLEGKTPCNWLDFVRGYGKRLTDQSWCYKII